MVVATTADMHKSRLAVWINKACLQILLTKEQSTFISVEKHRFGRFIIGYAEKAKYTKNNNMSIISESNQRDNDGN